MRTNDFINNLIELSKNAYYNKADAEDLDDIVYDILQDFDEELMKIFVDDLGRDYLIDMYKKKAGEYYLKQFPNYNDDDLIFTLIEYIWNKENIYSFFE
jgi:hypothetical protein